MISDINETRIYTCPVEALDVDIIYQQAELNIFRKRKDQPMMRSGEQRYDYFTRTGIRPYSISIGDFLKVSEIDDEEKREPVLISPAFTYMVPVHPLLLKDLFAAQGNFEITLMNDHMYGNDRKELERKVRNMRTFLESLKGRE